MRLQPIMPLQDLFKLKDEILLERLENLIPRIMKETDIRMWIIICDEYNEGPVIQSLLPSSFFHARGKAVIIFIYENEKVQRLIVSKPDFSVDAFYTPVLLKPPNFDFETFYSTFAPQYDLEEIKRLRTENTWQCINRILNEHDPETIAVEVSSWTAFSDGLSKSNYDELMKHIDMKFHTRIISSEKLTVRWLETRIDSEYPLFQKIVETTRKIIKNCYSRDVITPGKTTIGAARFYLMEEGMRLGMTPWFNATIWVRRRGKAHLDDDSTIIQKGDLLHCDFGLKYCGLCSDIQEMAYVRDDDDEELLVELKNIHNKAKKLQDILAVCFKEGATGNQILKNALVMAKEQGIQRPMIYSHPIWIYGHGPGPIIGRFGNQDYIQGLGEYSLHEDTCYAMELSIREHISAWDNMPIMYGQETEIVFKNAKVTYIGGRQEELNIFG